MSSSQPKAREKTKSLPDKWIASGKSPFGEGIQSSEESGRLEHEERA